jgi:DNA-binding MarR family transcriptional regulator
MTALRRAELADRYLAEAGTAGLFTRLSRVGLLLDAFQHRCLDRFALRFIDYSLLRVLHLAGSPYRMSPTELSELLLRSSGGVTQILDRLERAGLVARGSDPSDRRKVLVGLTPKGVSTAKKAHESYTAERDRLLGGLSAGEEHAIDAAIRRLLDIFNHDAAEGDA